MELFADAVCIFVAFKSALGEKSPEPERNAANWENGDRQMLELFYVRHASLALDLRIFVRTFKAVGRGQ